ncbi:hypothetical protein FF38_09080, partial [Lucilia cuprina]
MPTPSEPPSYDSTVDLAPESGSASKKARKPKYSLHIEFRFDSVFYTIHFNSNLPSRFMLEILNTECPIFASLVCNDNDEVLETSDYHGDRSDKISHVEYASDNLKGLKDNFERYKTRENWLSVKGRDCKKITYHSNHLSELHGVCDGLLEEGNHLTVR